MITIIYLQDVGEVSLFLDTIVSSGVLSICGGYNANHESITVVIDKLGFPDDYHNEYGYMHICAYYLNGIEHTCSYYQAIG